ncbi:MAG: hypothetical protein JSS61_06035 [Verrucomicrobia bacterium]|nr:hypothetical protein [Verrucomicrobiota bacterium]
MRIYNLDADQKIENVIIYLTPDEALEMKTSLDLMINDSNKHHHEHVLDSEYKREITVCIYKDDNLSSFDERSKRLILNDE